jgi:subtilase family serine protease
MAIERTDVTRQNETANAAGKPQTVSGYGPATFQQAYSIASASSTGGVGQTVAVVEAYGYPHAESDLATYRSHFGLAACTVANGCLSFLSQRDSSSDLPSANPNYVNWPEETALDVDMVSASCPNCHILIVEADTQTWPDLTAAEDVAARHAQVVSNSWGVLENSTDPSYDAHFNHAGVVTLASTGDYGYQVQWPAVSPNVVAVGGTNLLRNNRSATGYAETAWAQGGSGCSATEPQANWQQSVPALVSVCQTRAVADVSADASPSTGAAVYDTYSKPGWLVMGGTSLAAPLVGGMFALAGNEAGIAGDTATGGAPAAAHLYGSNASAFNDITSGSNGSCNQPLLCTAAPGWDGPTGLGSPHGLSAL